MSLTEVVLYRGLRSALEAYPQANILLSYLRPPNECEHYIRNARVLTVKNVLDKDKVVRLCVVCSVAGILVGLMVGMYARSVQSGACVGFGIFVIGPFILNLADWY